VHCRWEAEKMRIDHPPSYAETKKMESLALHIYGGGEFGGTVAANSMR